MKNIVLVDYNPTDEWEFVKALELTTNKKWEVKRYVTNKLHGGLLKTLIRYALYFNAAFVTFVQKRNYSEIIAWQQFFGLIFIAYCRFFKSNYVPPISIMTFIYKPKDGYWGKLYYRFVHYAVTSGLINSIFVFSKSEQEYYAKTFGVTSGLFVSLTLGIEDIYDKYKDKIIDNGEFLSAGRSNRDYEFLEKNWERSERILKIVCDKRRVSNANNIEYIRDCYNDEYFELLARCHAVIITLKDKHISSGQLVILQAMMLGKPVIATLNDTVVEYITSGENGIIINKLENELFGAICKLDDEKYYTVISTNARKNFEEKYSVYAMGVSIGKCITARMNDRL